MKVDDVLYLRSTFQVMTADEIKRLLQGHFVGFGFRAYNVSVQSGQNETAY